MPSPPRTRPRLPAEALDPQGIDAQHLREQALLEFLAEGDVEPSLDAGGRAPIYRNLSVAPSITPSSVGSSSVAAAGQLEEMMQLRSRALDGFPPAAAARPEGAATAALMRAVQMAHSPHPLLPQLASPQLAADDGARGTTLPSWMVPRALPATLAPTAERVGEGDPIQRAMEGLAAAAGRHPSSPHGGGFGAAGAADAAPSRVRRVRVEASPPDGGFDAAVVLSAEPPSTFEAVRRSSAEAEAAARSLVALPSVPSTVAPSPVALSPVPVPASAVPSTAVLVSAVPASPSQGSPVLPARSSSLQAELAAVVPTAASASEQPTSPLALFCRLTGFQPTSLAAAMYLHDANGDVEAAVRAAVQGAMMGARGGAAV